MEAKSISTQGNLDRRTILFELTAVLMIFMSYSAVRFLMGFPDTRPPQESIFNDIWSIVQHSSQIIIILYLIYRSGLTRSQFGLTSIWLKDILFGIGIWILEIFIQIIFNSSGYFLNLEKFIQNAGVGLGVLSLLTIIASTCFQELFMRGYLITRFEQLFDSKYFSAFLSAGLFSFWHAYQGPHGVIGTFISGLLFGFVFVKTRRLWPLIIAHTLWNLFAKP